MSHINVKDYGAVGDGVADDSDAIQAAIDALGGNKDQGGGTVWFDRGSFNITKPIVISLPGVHLRGAGGFTSTIRVDPALTGAAITYEVPGSICRGARLTDLRIYMRGAEATALRIIGGYDNCMVENLYIDQVGGSANGVEILPPPAESGIPVSQTFAFVNVWVSGSRRPETFHTGSAWYLQKLQEASFLACKGFGGSETSGTAWKIVDSRGLNFYGCSAAFADVGFSIESNTRATQGVTIDGPTLEGLSTTLKTTGELNSAQVYFRGPRPQHSGVKSAGPILLDSLTQSTLETRSIQVSIGSSCSQVQVLTDDLNSVDDAGTASTVVQWANNSSNTSLPSMDIAGQSPILGFRVPGGAIEWEQSYNTESGFSTRFRDFSGQYEALNLLSQISPGESAVSVLVNDGSGLVERRVQIGPPDSGGVGKRILTVDG